VSEDVAHRVARAVRAVVPPLVAVSVASAEGPLVDLRVGGYHLRAYWLYPGNPAHLREALLLLGSRLPDVFVARRLSPGAREAASRAGVGWIDETGDAELALDWLVISRVGDREPPSDRRRSHWTPAIAGVAEALLTGTKPTARDVASATGLSLGVCVRALNFFTESGFLTARAHRGRHSARRLAEPDRLLDEYASALTAFPRVELRVGVLWRDPVAGVSDLGRRWDAAGIRWAATGTVAAAVLAPYLTDVGTGEVFVAGRTREDLLAAAEGVSARPMEGGRLLLRLFPSLATERLSTRSDGLCIVPWPRVYADLRTVGVRGEDAAEHLREVMRGRGVPAL
jgi:hypothetical protein